MKAFIFDPLWDTLITKELLGRLKTAGVEIFVTKKIAPLNECKELFAGNEKRLLCLNPDYVGWNVQTDDYKNIPGLRAILGAATSFSWIDTSYATENGIVVANIRNQSTEAVADWAVMMLFNLARQIPRLIKDGFPLDFDKDFMKYRGIELKGKTVGIIGLGHNGTAIAERLHGLGLNVIYWSKNTRNDVYTYKELDEIFELADVIVPAFAHNEETDKIITNRLLSKLKPTAIIVDTIKLKNRDEVAVRVKNGKIFGYGFEAEPQSFDKYEGNVWAAPEYAWVTDGAMNSTMKKWIDNMVDAAEGKFPNKVN